MLLKETATALSDASDGIVRVGVMTITGVPVNPESRDNVVNKFLLAQKSLNQVDPYVLSFTPIRSWLLMSIFRSFEEIKPLVQDAKGSLSGALDAAQAVIDHC